MILFDLKCSNGHIFEAWFSDSKNFLKQSKNRAISCPFCQNDNIIKAPMAPNISTRRTKEKKGMGVDVAMPLRKGNITQGNFSAKASSRKEDSLKKSEKKIMKNFSKEMKKLREFVESNCTYVGKEFSKEIRKIHYGDSSPENIYGETSEKETQELVDEGIEFYHLPWFNRYDS